MVAGMGMNNFIKVAGDRWTGAMIPEALDKAIREQKALGKTPFFVNSVGGSTVMGSFDDQDFVYFFFREGNTFKTLLLPATFLILFHF